MVSRSIVHSGHGRRTPLVRRLHPLIKLGDVNFWIPVGASVILTRFFIIFLTMFLSLWPTDESVSLNSLEVRAG